MWDAAFLFSKNYFICFYCMPVFPQRPLPHFLSYVTRKKAKNITDHNFSYLQHSKSHKTHVSDTPATILQANKKKGSNTRYPTRFSACELQWCICNAASRLQAALQGHKQMAWYYSPDLGLPSGNRAVNHHLKKNRTGSANVWVSFSVKMCMVYLYCCPLYKYFLLQEAPRVMFWLNSWPASTSPKKQYLFADIIRNINHTSEGRDWSWIQIL